MPVSYTHLDVYKRQEYNIVKVYDNGVRIGVIRTNGRISTIFPDAASQP